MKKDSLLRHIQARLKTLQQYRKELEDKRAQLFQQCNTSNEGELWPQISKLSMQLWECRGMQKAYHDLREFLSQKTSLIIEQISQPSDSPEAIAPSQKTPPACPKCANILTITTGLDPAPQPGHITISTHYECQQCGYHESDQVNLPKEIALQRYNLENLMKGV